MRSRENINDSLGIYLNQIAQIPLLTESEEKELARSGNIEKLIEANLRLVVHWALSYTPNATQSTLDLIQEGNIGLVKAAHRYNPDKGYKFSTYASWWIRQAISQSINDNSKTIRLPNNIVTELNLVNKTTNNLTEKFNREPSSKEISGASGISLERLDELNEYNENILSFNFSYDSYSQLEEIYRHVKYVIDRRKYLSMINHLEKVFKNKINGDYHVEYRNFGSGEYIDIEYTDFTIRFVIQNMNLRVSIHDPDAYMRKNDKLFEECNYNRYSEIISDVAKYANTVYDNTSKVKRTLKKLVSLSNKNWMFDYTVSSFNLVEIKLYPIDDENNKWESIGTLKIK